MNNRVLKNLLLAFLLISNLIIVLTATADIHAQSSIVKISTSQSSGYVDSVITITGENFPGTRANLYWNDAPIARDIAISQDGSFNYDFTIPIAHKGAHIISADDNSNWVGGRAETEFNILPSIDIFPKVAQVLTPILVTGNGFNAMESDIKIMVDGSTIATPQISADSKGHWTASYTVHDLDKGRHTISASGPSTTSSETQSQDFILAPWLEIKPATGPVGTQLMIYGWGFMHNEDGITVTWDGKIIKVNIRAEVDGTLIVDGSKREYGTFTSGEEYHETVFVPKTTKGDHTVGVYGSSFTPRGTMPYYPFNVIPNLEVKPDSGHKGTYVTIEGTGFSNGEAIQLKYDDNEIGNSISADSTGSFSTQYVIPQSTAPEHTFTAQGNKGSTAAAKFNIDVIEVSAPSLEAPVNGEIITLFDSVGDVYLSSIRYLIGLGDFLSGQSNVSPENDITYFKWNIENAPSDIQYILQISTDDSFQTVNMEKILSNNVFSLTRNNGLKSGQYYWRVGVFDSNSIEGNWSQTYSFEINTMPFRAAIFSIIVLVLIIAAIVFVIILLWTNAINKYKY